MPKKETPYYINLNPGTLQHRDSYADGAKFEVTNGYGQTCVFYLDLAQLKTVTAMLTRAYYEVLDELHAADAAKAMTKGGE